MTRRGPLRVAIVGAGLMGRWHARAAERAGGIVAVVIDADDARGARLAAKYGARHTRSIADISGRPADSGVDVVHICTPLETHASLARTAIDVGAHALVEKPLTSTVSETSALLQHAEARGVLLCPVHQFLFQRGVRQVLAARTAIGPVLHVDAVACSAGGGDDGEAARDRIAADILPHPLSLFTAVLDQPVAGFSWSVQRTSAGELRASAAAGNATVSLLVSMSGRPTANSLRVIAARGTAHADLFHGFAVVERGNVSRVRKITHPFAFAGAMLGATSENLARRALARETAYPGLSSLVAAFYAAARGEAPPPISPAQTLDVAQARDAVLAR